jgi:hypothetical protein
MKSESSTPVTAALDFYLGPGEEPQKRRQLYTHLIVTMSFSDKPPTDCGAPDALIRRGSATNPPAEFDLP